MKRAIALVVAATLFLMFALPALGAPAPYQASGQLVSTGNVIINSVDVPNGATVLTDSHITVKAPVHATINLGPLGKVDLAPNTDITLQFSGNSVTVLLNTGTVTVTTQSGTTGVIKTNCATRVEVAQGNVSVKTDTKTDTVSAGRSERSTGGADVAQTGPGSFTASAQCAPLFSGPTGTTGPVAQGAGASASLPTGLTIAIIGGSVAAAIILGVTLGGRPEGVSPA